MDPLEQSTLDTSKTVQAAGPQRYLGVAILCHPNLSRVGEVARLLDLGSRADVRLSRTEPLFRDRSGAARGPLATTRSSRLPLTLRFEGDGGLRIEAPEGMQLFVDESAASGETKCSAGELEAGVSLRIGKYVLLWLGLFQDARRGEGLPQLIGQSEPMQRLRTEIMQVADLDVPVMLRGETGVGKELVASALHELGGRRSGPYVCVNMAAIPSSMAAAELFGHGRGAFTGAAAAREGYFADADGGTLFLDEIGETASEVQPILLRAVETGVIQPLGGKLRKVDVRLIAATDSDLETAVEQGSFHGALMRRFGFEVWIPPLRERRSDIPELFAHFLQQELEQFGEGQRLAPDDPDLKPFLRADFVARLLRHRWPGNVRELRNVARRFAIHNRGKEQAEADERLLALLGPERGSTPLRPSSKPSARELSDEQVLEALRAHAFRVEQTADALGVSRSWLHARMNLQRIRKATHLSAAEIRAALDHHDGDMAAAAAELQVSERGLQLQLARLGTQAGDR